MLVRNIVIAKVRRKFLFCMRYWLTEDDFCDKIMLCGGFADWIKNARFQVNFFYGLKDGRKFGKSKRVYASRRGG